MQVTHKNCAGIDVHKKTVVVCCLSEDSKGQSRRETRTYGTTTAELLRLSEWFATESITHIAIGLYRGILETRVQHAGEQL
jgi:hypothetical protein